MAIVLGGLILTAAASFLFGIFNLTLIAEKEPLFQEHVDTSSRFLEHAFSAALGDEDDNDSPGPVSWRRIPGEIGLNPEALSFRLPGEFPIFQAEGMFVPDVTAYLIFRQREGLFFHWQTDAMRAENEDDLRVSLISPNVTEVLYLYYDRDNNSWDESKEAESNRQGETLVPDFIQITYTHSDGREAKRQILLPANSELPLP